ncbi:AAA family ATPase [Streptomyces lavendulae]|uniref:AAA family ATPase n=1 Tax=Streptomyces lavendulae TaxID=1914 RepID=UPI00249FAFAC|nr:AAA family ATPase [Streptomyces lavendulae]GLW03933.1 hypothetical protein Slala05_75630 [Streptomyces lavendulae subsp. lavendulae]
MIIWINGAFGAGKSTLATGLREALPGSVVADPEDVGSILRSSMRGHPHAVWDYQEYPAWRRLTVRLVTELHHLAGGTVIVPMTVLHQPYARDVLEPLAALGVPVHHLVLHTDPSPLRARIDASLEYPHDEARSEAVRAHRRRRINDYEQAFKAWLNTARVIDTGKLTPGQALEAALAQLART